MQNKLRIARLVSRIIVILIVVAIPTLGLISTSTSWQGTCYGFTDGTWACPWTEFFGNQMGYIAIFSIMPLALFGSLWLLLTIIHIILKKRGENAS